MTLSFEGLHINQIQAICPDLKDKNMFIWTRVP